jgi:hypothetical protein
MNFSVCFKMRESKGKMGRGRDWLGQQWVKRWEKDREGSRQSEI